jgi:type I restriction enzyme S subunit
MIPNGWKRTTIGDVATELKSGLSRKLSLSDLGLPVIRSTNITSDGRADFTDVKYWYVDDPQGASTEHYLVAPGDILVNFINSVAQIGKTALYQGELARKAIYTTNLFRLRLDDVILPEYFLFLTGTSEYAKYVYRITNPAVNQASFTSKDFKRFRFPLPPLMEQRKIAAILRTWDEAIALGERCLEAARLRKKGLMQMLLTRRLQFAQFAGNEWQEARLREAFERVTRSGGSAAQHILSISAGVGFEPQDRKFSRIIAGDSLANYVLLRRGEFAYNRGNSKAYPQGCIYQLEQYEEAAVPNVYYSFAPSSDAVLGDFYKHYFASGALNSQLRRVINTGVRNDGLLNIHADDFFNCKIPLPSREEQERIAHVLATADREIALLEEKRSALREQKKGLMQRLLTGRVRVKP